MPFSHTAYWSSRSAPCNLQSDEQSTQLTSSFALLPLVQGQEKLHPANQLKFVQMYVILHAFYGHPRAGSAPRVRRAD